MAADQVEQAIGQPFVIARHGGFAPGQAWSYAIGHRPVTYVAWFDVSFDAKSTVVSIDKRRP